MRKTAHVQRRFDTEHRILDKLAEILPPNQPAPWSYPAIAERIGEPAHAVLLAKRTMEDAGILRTTLEYPKGQSGRVSVWELTMPLNVAHEEMSKEHELQLIRPSRKAERQARMVHTGEPQPLQSVPVPRPDESFAWLRRAEEYRGRIEWARNHLKEMSERGIEVDPESVTIQRDETLEAVALTLPAFEELTRERDRLREQNERWRVRLEGDGKARVGSPVDV